MLVDINPIAFMFFGIDIRWYGISYFVSPIIYYVIIRFYIIQKINFTPLTHKMLYDIMLVAIWGLLIGSTLGYYIIYCPHHLLDPMKILCSLRSGKSFHGGLIGAMIGIYWFCRKNNIPLINIFDFGSVGIPVGMIFGRMANFINQEMIGRPTDLPWAVIYARVDDLPRHPTQLYECLSEGFLMLIISICIVKFCKYRPGMLFGVNILGYGICRIIVELFKDIASSEVVSHINISQTQYTITLGQIVSLPMLVLGICLILHSMRSRQYT